MTGADSPVIADSSTEAMPSITVPSPGITSPASTTTTSPRISSDAARSPPSASRAVVSERIARSEAACARPRPSASASARLAKTTVSHSQTAIVKREPARVAAVADDPGDRGDQRADLDHEHDRVADLHARVELAQRRRGDEAGRDGDRAPRGLRPGRGGDCGHRSSASLSLVVFTPGSPSRPRKRPSVFSRTSCWTRSSGIPRTRATRRAWIAALASEMCGSTPEPDVVTASAGGSAPLSLR